MFAEDETSEVVQTVRRIGRGLHLVETIRLYMDGGQSYDNLLAHVGKLRDDLLSVAAHDR